MKKGTEGSLTVEASVIVPVFIIAFAVIFGFFDTFLLLDKADRSIYEASESVILGYAELSLFEGIVENAVKRQLLEKRFEARFEEGMAFRDAGSKTKEFEADLSDMFRGGENEGYIRCSFNIAGISFSRSIFVKTFGEGVNRGGAADDVWKLDPLLRGRILIRRFGGNMGQFFELISRFIDGEACVIKSVNPDLGSYQVEGAIYDSIFPYIERLAAYTGPVGGQAVTSKRLLLIMPADAKNANISAETQRLRDECAARGIVFEAAAYGFLYK